MGSIPGSGRSPGGGHGNLLLYSSLENPMDRGAWWATVHRFAKSQTPMKGLNMHTLIHIYGFFLSHLRVGCLVILRFIHVIACISNSLFSMAQQYFIISKYQSLPIVDGHQGCSQLLVKPAVNITSQQFSAQFPRTRIFSCFCYQNWNTNINRILPNPQTFLLRFCHLSQ